MSDEIKIIVPKGSSLVTAMARIEKLLILAESDDPKVAHQAKKILRFAQMYGTGPKKMVQE